MFYLYENSNWPFSLNIKLYFIFHGHLVVLHEHIDIRDCISECFGTRTSRLQLELICAAIVHGLYCSGNYVG